MITSPPPKLITTPSDKSINSDPSNLNTLAKYSVLLTLSNSISIKPNKIFKYKILNLSMIKFYNTCRILSQVKISSPIKESFNLLLMSWKLIEWLKRSTFDKLKCHFKINLKYNSNTHKKKKMIAKLTSLLKKSSNIK
jgi:hypothetical protein